MKFIKEIMKVMGDFEGSFLGINISPHEIWFNIYDMEIPIVIDKENKYALRI